MWPSAQEMDLVSSTERRDASDPARVRKTRAVRLAIAALATWLPLAAFAASPNPTTPMNAADSDPVKLGWMVGAPPPPDKTIRYTDPDYFQFPKLRWTVCHFRQLMPTVGVGRGAGAAIPFERAIDDAIDAVTFTPIGADTRMSWAQSLDANYTDGIVVLKDGVVVYERYRGCLDADGQHGAMSVTKSLTGLLGEMLVAQGAIDENAQVASIVPELADSAFGDATVRQVLEMTTGLRYSEDYADPDAEVWAHAAAGSTLPKPADYDGPRNYYDYLKTVRPQGRHGEAFGYKTVNTDVLGWIIARKTGQSVAELLQSRLWSRMGAEQDAYYTVDSSGIPFAGGGFSSGLRDLARVGQILLGHGRINGQQLIPAKAIERILAGGDKAAFAKAGYGYLKGWSYRGMWWISHNPHGAYMARGVHGQSLYIDPKAGVVIARFASTPTAANSANDPTTLPAFDAVAAYLMDKR